MFLTSSLAPFKLFTALSFRLDKSSRKKNHASLQVVFMTLPLYIKQNIFMNWLMIIQNVSTVMRLV